MADSCKNIRAQMAFYLDDELRNGERDEFEAHLNDCPSCHELFEQERMLLEVVRASQPLYQAPAEMRARLERIIEQTPEQINAPHNLRRRIQDALSPAPIFQLSPMRLSALAILLLAIALGALWAFRIGSMTPGFPRPSDIALMAVETHLRRLRGQLPLEIISESPVQISDWFSGKVSFSLKLPNYQESSGQEKLYRLEGARLVAFNNDYAAYIAYRMRQSPITLVVTANSVATPSGGEEIVSKGVKFHYNSINGLKVITWTDRGLTYALVSDLEERGQQSCLVCHAGTKDRDFIEGLKIR
ncbi:MAG: zf-HC2 domain-containing protein [Blastocatellia bacterium]|nr:zf-HC2 domain-containing protein [Blastocatellia bacterium]